MSSIASTFDNARLGAQSKNSTAAILVGIQSFEGLTPYDATNYATHLGQTLTQLRQNNIPVIWAVIDSIKGNKPFLPQQGATDDRRSFDELRQMGFEDFEEGDENGRIFKLFLENYGPQENEAVFRKSFMSALTESTDIDHPNRESHQRELLLQAGVILKGTRENLDPKYFREIDVQDANKEFLNFFREEPTTADYLRQMNVNRTLVMGNVAYYCNLETAVSAALKGFNPTIINNRCLGWIYQTVEGKEIKLCVWQEAKDNEGNYLNVQFNHKNKIQNRIDEIVSQEADMRGFSSNDIDLIKNIRMSDFSDVMRDLGINNTNPVIFSVSEPQILTHG